ncbi:MAG: divergent polysaccharide deacetylase family protein, partial [Pseudomonadota bacterium]
GVTANIDSVGEVSSQYRQNGFEIVAVMPDVGPLAVNRETDLDDIEVLMAGILNSVPGSTTILDPIDSPLPQNRRMAGAVLEALKQTGHGLLTHRGNGLNNVPIIADQEGVPSELIYRVIDEVPGSANIALALERAVLDASRGGSVIVVGHVRQETVTTILSWLLGSGAREVTIAPVSAILQTRGQG